MARNSTSRAYRRFYCIILNVGATHHDSAPTNEDEDAEDKDEDGE